jgi:hypothetical protein
MIEIADLWKSFGGLSVLRGVSLQVERGSIVAIIRASTPKTPHPRLSRPLSPLHGQLPGSRLIPCSTGR